VTLRDDLCHVNLFLHDDRLDNFDDLYYLV
jgi:hypothetical protein